MIGKSVMNHAPTNPTNSLGYILAQSPGTRKGHPVWGTGIRYAPTCPIGCLASVVAPLAGAKVPVLPFSPHYDLSCSSTEGLPIIPAVDRLDAEAGGQEEQL